MDTNWVPPLDLDLPRWIRYAGLLGRGGQTFVIGADDIRRVGGTGDLVGPVAIKCYPRRLLVEDRRRFRVLREVINHRRLKHNHVVGFREVRLTRNYLLIVLEIVNGGNLKKVLKHGRLSEEEARWYFQQLVCGTDYCHRSKVLNRDISLENILLDELDGIDGVLMRGCVRLCDFGLSRDECSVELHSNIRPISAVGKVGYIAPEIIHRPAGAPRLGAEVLKKSDIFSLGVCLYKMLLGVDRWPLVDSNEGEMSPREIVEELVNASRGPFELVPGLRDVSANDMSDECKDLLNRTLQRNSENRIAMHEIWEHQWFKEGLPPRIREYNDEVTAEEFARQHMRGVQSEEEVTERINAGADFSVENDCWY
ncbi:hypothetical protein BSKO_07834 [Bryopsis sp. KO-2023]|nr:hypothetical protein BSKO_07834 [Bryopsis sp. KO-2023]